ncbi:MAG: CRISPR system precrRNA processing endoribonuclease RAMP protein Cas6 [Sulfuricurvum sp.]
MVYTTIRVMQQLPLAPPYFLGSIFHDRFGYALKKVVCILPSGRCEECFAASTCLYAQWYHQSAPSWRLELYPKSWNFSLILLGEDHAMIPYLLSALHQMLIHTNYGKERLYATSFTIFLNDHTVFDGHHFRFTVTKPKLFLLDTLCHDVMVELATPLKLQKNNRQVWFRELELIDILQSIENNLRKTQGKEPKLVSSTGEITQRWLRFGDFSRSHTPLLEGLMGSVKVCGLDQDSYTLLKMGEIVGVGEGLEWGLGKITITEEKE